MKICSMIAVGCLIGAATPATATTVILNSAIQTYRAPDGSRNYTEPSAFWDTHLAVVGASSDPDPFHASTGRFAATLEFGIGALPTDAIITGATLTLGIFFRNDSIDTMSSYAATAIAADPARVQGGKLITAFDVQDIFLDNGSHPQFNVTSTVKSSLGGAATNPILGFAFEQVVDRCLSTRSNYCISSIGGTFDNDLPTLTVSYDVPSLPPPSSAVPEPATWSMFIGGFGLIGAALRRRRERAAILPEPARR